MTPAAGGRAWIVLGIALSVAFAVLAHAALVQGVSPAVGAVLSLVPLTLLALWAARRARRREAVIAVAVAAAIALWLGWALLERHCPDLLFVEHAATNLALGLLFGRTLLAGREPLVSTFARVVHGRLPPEVARYTRRVTLAWTIFFALLFAASCVLYLAHLREAWSVLANFVTPVGVAAMFAVEIFVRHRVLPPDWERVGIVGSVRAFSRHFSQAAR